MTEQGKLALQYMLCCPAALGRRLGYRDLRDELHGAWMRQMLTSEEDMTLQAHRGSYKTTCLCIVLAILLVTQPDKTILFLRKTDSDVTEVLRQVARILAHPEFERLSGWIYSGTSSRSSDAAFAGGTALQHEAAATEGKATNVAKLIGGGAGHRPGSPVKTLRATSSALTTDAYAAPRGAVQLLGIGLGGSLTGKHADIIVTDDIVNLHDRISRAERERTRAVYMELQNVKNRGGRIINTGTPWHRDDAFCLMPPPQRYDCYATGLIDEEKLAQLKASMSPSLFAANYELRHVAAENALFGAAPRFTDDESLLRDGIAHIDAAYGGEDYTALTCAKRQGDTIYLYGRLWRAHVDTVLCAALAECDRLLCAPVYCESNGDKGYLAREIRGAGGVARVYAETMNKVVKISSYLRKWWGNIVFVQGTDEAYIAQIVDYNEDAAHDDAPDSAASACRILDAKRDDEQKYVSIFARRR